MGFIVFCILGAGLYFLVRLRAFFIFRPVRSLRLWWKTQKDGKREPAATLSLALAGTLGVGNVTGVAFCLLRGGAGSAFWMLVSAAFAAALKYAESVVTVYDREAHKRRFGGMPYVVKNSWKIGDFLSVTYALLCLFTAFTMGSALQARAITETVTALYGLPIFPFAVLAAVLAFLLIRGGKKEIEKASGVLVPLATLLYTALCLTVLIRNRAALPGVLSQIVSDAFSPRSAAYGVGGFAFGAVGKRAYAGISAGLLSNESGAGTSTLAHGGNLSASPTSEGILGTFEILVDTVFLCTLTALTLLCGGHFGLSKTAMDLIADTFTGTFGPAYRLPFTLAVFIFALATVICWFSYGDACRFFLFGENGKAVYTALYIAAVFIGGFLPTETCIPLSDAFLALLSVICLTTLLKNAQTVVRLTENDGFLKKRKK